MNVKYMFCLILESSCWCNKVFGEKNKKQKKTRTLFVLVREEKHHTKELCLSLLEKRNTTPKNFVLVREEKHHTK